ncbi:unnamed protein product [Onchocerca ochengi]|uniref:Uncharacterized protein n=1 Tax=Onchocerca ochengi TaxID=42157 RepID=A0A182E459_ONCOC|nr:unnamed protein product [Onchocerca ochengi]
MGNATCSVSLVPQPPLLLLLRRRRIRRRDDASDGGRCSAPGRGHNIDRCKGRHDEVQVQRGVSCRCLDSVDRSCLIKLNSASKGRKGRNVSLKEAPIKGFPCNTVDAACSG